MQKPVTTTDIARITGYSQSTVSRALGGVRGIAPATRKAIAEAAEQLGYQPNRIARGLITGESNMIGLVTSDIRNPFYPEVIELFSAELRKLDFSVMFVNSASSEIPLEDVLPFVHYKVKSVVVTAASLSSDTIQYLVDSGIHVLMFNRYSQIGGCTSVSCDNVGGGKLVGDTLIQTGHRRIAFVAGSTNTSTSRDRWEGFTDALNTTNIEPLMVHGGYTYEGGFAAGMSLFQHDNPPDAIFCANDIMALGVLDSARRLGVDVPNDVSIVGFDDIRLASWDAYSLTTVRQPVEEMVRAVVNLLTVKPTDTPAEPTMKFIAGQLVMRNTLKNRT